MKSDYNDVSYSGYGEMACNSSINIGETNPGTMGDLLIVFKNPDVDTRDRLWQYLTSSTRIECPLEICDGMDNDCDGTRDDGYSTDPTCDTDGDGVYNNVDSCYDDTLLWISNSTNDNTTDGCFGCSNSSHNNFGCT